MYYLIQVNSLDIIVTLAQHVTIINRHYFSDVTFMVKNPEK